MKKNNVKVSIIVPVWNVEEYLPECLDSLVNQTLNDIEIIVVNDESPDGSQSIIDKYVKEYPNKIKSYIKKNGGQGSARNLALKIAKGEYIGFVDSDDWVETNMYQEMYDKAVNENLELIICDMEDHFKDHTIYYDCTNFDNIYYKTSSACNKLFKKTIIKDIFYIEKKLWYEDFNFTTKILLKNPSYGVIHSAFYHCHCREESTMNNNNSIKNLDIIEVIDDLKKYAKQNNCYDEDLFNYLIFDHVLLSSINRVQLQKNKDKFSVIKKLTSYCKKNISNYRKMPFYNSIPKNRKIIANLNYYQLSFLSHLLLKVKDLIKK